MKITKQILHEECKNCDNLKTVSVYMDGSAYYSCRCTPNHVEKDRHKSPCHRFINCNNYFVMVEKDETNNEITQANTHAIELLTERAESLGEKMDSLRQSMENLLNEKGYDI